MRFAMVVFIAACGFRAHDEPLPDAPPDALPDVAIDAPPPFCDPSDPQLVACFEFEGNTLDSSNHHYDATMTNVAFAPSKWGMAMAFGATSAADVDDHAGAFDLAAITIEAWIEPTEVPVSGRAGIVDNNGQYGFFLHPGGELHCTMVNGVSLAPAIAAVVAGQWTHVACTYDGSTTRIYANGSVIAEGTGGSVLATGGNTGISIAADNPPGSGSQLFGLIDRVRITSNARTHDEICADADRSACP